MNRYDNFTIKVPLLYKKYRIDVKEMSSKFCYLGFIYSFRLVPIVFRSYLWYFFTRLKLDLRWFYDFKKYWEKCLGGVTLWGIEDFYFLRGIYRQKFHQLSLPKVNSFKTHLMVWQKPEVIYFLLDMVYRQSLYNELSAVSLYQNYCKQKKLPILEFGCGTAPIATTFIEFYEHQNQKIYISDIQTLAFHYAAYKFRSVDNVVPLLLISKDNFSPYCSEKLGAIFCLTVFEHVTDPLNVAKKFYELLVPGGILIFDYLKTGGKGLDSKLACKNRDVTLKFIENNFKMIIQRNIIVAIKK